MSKHYLFWLERLVGATASVYFFVYTGLSALFFGAAFLTLLIAYLPFILYRGILREAGLPGHRRRGGHRP